MADLVGRHGRSLMRVAQHWSLCHDDALDAYQRALEIYVRRLESLDPATEVAWLKVVVKHEALAVRRQRGEAVPVDDVDLDARPREEQRPVDDLLAGRERVKRSAEALRRLKRDEAQALMLKAEGHSYQEIADKLQWTYTKVNRCITEGRAHFLEAFAEIEAGEECDRVAPTLAALVAGTASADALLEIRPHIRNCATCRATIRDLHATRLGRLGALVPLPALVAPLRWLSGKLNGAPQHAQSGADATALADGLRAGTGERPGSGATSHDPMQPYQDLVAGAVPRPGADGVAVGPIESYGDDAPDLEPLQGVPDLYDVIDRLPSSPSAAADQSGRLLDLKVHVYQWLHRLQGSDVAASAQLAAGAGGGGRIATIGAIVGLCLSGVGAGTVCVVTGVVSIPLTGEPHEPRSSRTQRKPPAEKREPVIRDRPARTFRATPTPTPTPTPAPKPTPARHEPKSTVNPKPASRTGSSNDSSPTRATTGPSTQQEYAPPSPPPADAAPAGGSEFDPTYQPSAPPAPAPAPAASGGGEFF